MSLPIFFIFAVFLYGCGPNEKASTTLSTSLNQSAATISDGAAIFQKNCKICHGADGKLGLNGAKDLSMSVLSLPERINIITYGKNLMTPFGQILSTTEISAVAAYTIQLHTTPK